MSRNGELAFWDLRPYAKELRERLGARRVRELRRRALADRSGPRVLTDFAARSGRQTLAVSAFGASLSARCDGTGS